MLYVKNTKVKKRNALYLVLKKQRDFRVLWKLKYYSKHLNGQCVNHSNRDVHKRYTRRVDKEFTQEVVFEPMG